METMNREQMLKELTEFCQARPIDACSTCPIKRRLAHGYGCIKIADRTDEQLAFDMKRLPVEEPVEEPIEVIEEPEQKAIQYMVTVDRDALRFIRGELVMLSRCVGATITEAIAEELREMAEAIYEEIEAADRERIEADKAMREAMTRAFKELEQKEEEEESHE